jgi:hypothetical protein
MFDVELALGPIKAQYPGAADEPVQVWSIEGVIDTKGLVAHDVSDRFNVTGRQHRLRKTVRAGLIKAGRGEYARTLAGSWGSNLD